MAMKCYGCGQEIKSDDCFFLKIEPGETPEIYCDYCISID